MQGGKKPHHTSLPLGQISLGLLAFLSDYIVPSLRFIRFLNINLLIYKIAKTKSFPLLDRLQKLIQLNFSFLN